MDLRVTIHLTRRRLEHFRLHPLGEPQNVDGAMNAGFCRLYRIVLVVNRRRWTREIEYLVDFDIQRETDVVSHQLEVAMSEEVCDVGPRAGVEVVHAQHFNASLHEPL